jgi:TonB-linked SusC/RagA family outer membrane protein
MLLTTGISMVTYATDGSHETAQKKTVTGVVSETGGETLPGVSVSVKGTTAGTITDAGGEYSIAAESNSVLVFSYMGKKPVETVVGNRNIISIVMEEDTHLLEEVVVQIGYMTQKKADLTGALAMAGAEDLKQNPTANAMKALQGKLPGVLITSNGNPAEDVGIQIRGITSMRASDPLIVVDGQPVNINFRDINSLDIESIQVLKDAASASIYGSRAASGVILIETRKAKRGGGVSIDYDSYFGFSRLTNKPQMLNTNEYGQAIWQATVNDGDDPTTAIRIYNYDWSRDAAGIPVLHSVAPVEWLNSAQTMPSADTDWWDEMMQTGFNITQQVTVSSGTEKSRTMFSLNYYDNQGTLIESFFRRYSARMNSDYDLIKDRLKFGETFTVSHLKFNGRSDVYNAIIMPSIVPVHTTDGGWGGTAMSMGMDDYNNPIRGLTMEKDNPDYFLKTLGSVYMDLAILKNLHLKTQFGVDYSNYYYRQTDHTWEEGGGRSDIISGVNTYQNHTVNYTWTNTLIYNLASRKHSLDILLGQEVYHFANEGFRSYRSDVYLESKDYAYLNATTGNTRIQEGWGDESALLSYFGKFNYSYGSRYLLSATIRYDGASKFGASNRFGTFPAFSAGWRLSEEAFMKDLAWLSDLKLRASWGLNGNSNIPTNALTNIYGAGYNQTAYAIDGNESGTLGSGYYKIHTGNANLQWEATEQTNFGLDFGFLNNSFRGSFDYFFKRTNDMLFEPPYIGSLGEGGYQWVNAADMQNTGIELLLGYYRQVSTDFNFNITGTLSSFRNKITSLPENVRYNYGGNGLLDDILGRPINSHYGLVADGIFKTQEEVDNSPEQQGKGLGRIRYKDLDGDGRIDETYDRTWLGVPHPDFEGGLNFDAQYHDFDFTLYFQGVFGRQIYNSWKEYSDFWNITVQNDKNHPARILDAWSLTNRDSDIPALSRRNENQELRFSSYYIEDGSYVKLRTAELGYTLPKPLAEKLYMQRFRLFVSGHNLFMLKKFWGADRFTGPDPENADFAYRMPLSMTFGFNVTF